MKLYDVIEYLNCDDMSEGMTLYSSEGWTVSSTDLATRRVIYEKFYDRGGHGHHGYNNAIEGKAEEPNTADEFYPC